MEYTDPKSGITIRVNRDAHESEASYLRSLSLIEDLKNKTTKPRVKASKSFIKNLFGVK